ncbi:MAG: ankyrin repeat domain-containing protein, partial [Alphaproteobacteria bacterium]|nr:ankyrin repeat domain-containing protein [Alphaproteobacteria bacterium]
MAETFEEKIRKLQDSNPYAPYDELVEQANKELESEAENEGADSSSLGTEEEQEDYGDSIEDRNENLTLEDLAYEEENKVIKADDEKANDTADVESSTASSSLGTEDEQDNVGFSFNFGNSNDVNITVNGSVGEEDEIETPEEQQEVPQEENDEKDEKITGYTPSENEEEVDRSTKETEPQIDPEKPARTSLHTASDRATTENIDDVIAQNKDDINKRSNDEYGVTPLMCAVNKGNAAMADALLENGADINMTNNVGETALMYAAANGNMELIEKLVERGADTEMKAGKGSAYEGQDFRAVLRDNLEASGKTPEEIEKTMADVEKMIAQKQGKSGEQTQTLAGNENASEKENAERPDFHDKANWDRVGVRNQEGGIDEGYRFNLSGMSQEEMRDFVGNLQENGIKGDLRQATIDTDNVKKGDLSYRITDPESVKRLEGLVFGEKQQEVPEQEIENTDTQKIDVIKQDKDGKGEERPVSPSVEQSGNDSKRDDEKTDESEQPKASKAEKESPSEEKPKEEKQSFWSKVKGFASRVFGKKDKKEEKPSAETKTPTETETKSDKDNSEEPIDYDNEQEATKAFAEKMGLNGPKTPPSDTRVSPVSRPDAETVMDYEDPQAMAQMTAEMLKEGPTKNEPQPEEKPREAFTNGKN